MAFPAVQSVTATAFTTNTTAHLVAMPATVDAGDLLLMVVVFDGGPTITNPTGWTELLNVASENAHGKIVTAKVADGTEDSTTVDVVTSAAEQAAAQVYRITGWFGTIATGVEVGTSNGAGGVTTNSPPAFNPTNWNVEDTLWIACLTVGLAAAGADVSGYPASYTNGTETDSAGGSAGALLGTARRENATASEDAGDFTLTNAPTGSRAFVLAVRPSGAGTQALTGTLFTKAPTFFTGTVTATRNLVGSLFTKAPTFFTGTVTATRNLAGSLFTKAPTFFTGTVTSVRALTGVLFTKAPTFPTGAVSLASSPQTVNGVLFTKAPTFPTGAVTATYALTGTLFVKAPMFFTGTVTVGAVTLNGILFTKAPTFPQGAITTGAVTLTGVLFQKAPTFPTGTVTAGTITLGGVLYQSTPTFPTGTIGQAGTLFGNLFQKAPTFFTGTITRAAPTFWITNPAGYTPNPVAYVRIGGPGPSPWGTQLSGRRFEKAPTFPVGVVS